MKLKKFIIFYLILTASLPAESAAAYFEKGRAARTEGNLRESLEYFREAIRRNPSYNAARNEMASVYLEMGDPVRALGYYAAVLGSEPENLQALTGAAESQIRLGNSDSARDYLNRADRISPGDPEKNFTWGNFYRSAGKTDLAEQFYQRALRSNPAHIKSLLQLALIAAERGDDSGSAKYIKRVRALNPDHPELYRTSGDIAMRRALAVKHSAMESDEDRQRRDSFFSEAYQHYSTSLRFGESPETEKKMVLIDFYRGRFQSALSRAQSLETVFHDDAELLYKTGFLKYILSPDGNLNETVEWYRKAIKEAPDDPLARFALEEAVLSDSYTSPLKKRLADELAEYNKNLHLFYTKRNKPDKALLFMRRALALSPGDDSMRRARLEYYYRVNDYENFLKELQYLAASDPDDTRLRFRLQHAAGERMRSLPFRENLISPETDPVKATFRRNPEQIFIFDFQPEESFPVHPDASIQITKALYFHLNEGGRIAPVSTAMRNSVMSAVYRKTKDPFYRIYGIRYRPDFIRFIEEAEDRRYPVHYILQGRYRDSLTGLRVRFEVLEKSTGRPLHAFSFEAQGSEALHEIAARAANNLRRLLPLRAEVIRSSAGGVFLNTGTIDEVREGDEFTVHNRRTDRKLKVKIKETGRYASLAEPVNAPWHEFLAGDPAEPSVAKNQ